MDDNSLYDEFLDSTVDLLARLGIESWDSTVPGQLGSIMCLLSGDSDGLAMQWTRPSHDSGWEPEVVDLVSGPFHRYPQPNVSVRPGVSPDRLATAIASIVRQYDVERMPPPDADDMRHRRLLMSLAALSDETPEADDDGELDQDEVVLWEGAAGHGVRLAFEAGIEIDDVCEALDCDAPFLLGLLQRTEPDPTEEEQ